MHTIPWVVFKNVLKIPEFKGLFRCKNTTFHKK